MGAEWCEPHASRVRPTRCVRVITAAVRCGAVFINVAKDTIDLANGEQAGWSSGTRRVYFRRLSASDQQAALALLDETATASRPS